MAPEMHLVVERMAKNQTAALLLLKVLLSVPSEAPVYEGGGMCGECPTLACSVLLAESHSSLALLTDWQRKGIYGFEWAFQGAAPSPLQADIPF